MKQGVFLYQINVTRDCNLRCSHCYISSDKKASSTIMSQEQVLKIIDDIVCHMNHDALHDKLYREAEIHIIGGEPTMLGIEYYKDLLPEVNRKLDSISQTVSLKIVSNLLSPDSVEIVSLFDECSTSFEFDTRFSKKKLQDRWEERVRLILDEQLTKLSVTSSITKQAVMAGPEELCSYLTNLGFRLMHFGFFIPSGDGLINKLIVAPTHEDTSDFLIGLTDWYLNNKNKFHTLMINPVQSMLKSLEEDEASDDIICPIIPGSLDFDSDGNTVTCIEKGGEVDVDWIGNVFDESVLDLLGSSKYLKERLNSIRPKDVCANCEYFHVCKGACHVLHQQWNGLGECPGFSNWISYCSSKLKSLNKRIA